MSRFQLVPHLQWNSPVNCCFILRPQFGQICLLAPHIALLELCKDFFSRHTAGKYLFQYGFCFSLFGFFCGLFFGSNLFCLCFRKFLCCNLQSRFFTFQLFLQCANVARQCGNLGFNLFLGCDLFSNNSRILVMLQASPSAQAQRET